MIKEVLCKSLMLKSNNIAHYTNNMWNQKERVYSSLRSSKRSSILSLTKCKMLDCPLTDKVSSRFRMQEIQGKQRWQTIFQNKFSQCQTLTLSSWWEKLKSLSYFQTTKSNTCPHYQPPQIGDGLKTNMQIKRSLKECLRQSLRLQKLILRFNWSSRCLKKAQTTFELPRIHF